MRTSNQKGGETESGSTQSRFTANPIIDLSQLFDRAVISCQAGWQYFVRSFFNWPKDRISTTGISVA